ncbi:MAG: tyrosine/phenylalanine carboxypeptidase domain-containing protein [Candidatus Woesearchaeota archaeon]
MADFFKLKNIDASLQQVINPVSFFEINPINNESEKIKVLADPDYDPYFIYPELDFDYDAVQSRLNSIDDHDSAFGELLSRKRNLFIDKCEMLNNRGSKKFTVFSRKVYGTPSNEALDHSANLLTLECEKEAKTIDPITAKHRIQAEVNHYGFGYDVDTKNMSASAAVLVSKKKIFIKDNFMFSDNFIKRLVIHEIGTHVLRAENGREQPFMMFFHGFPDYLATEEGLAVVNEERFGLLNNENIKNYAARAVAVQMALTKSFSEIYKYLLQFFQPSTAFRITTRVKRGIADTSRPGGCQKDYVYIDGYLKVKKYLAEGGSINDLYVGKIGIEHLDIVKEMQSLNKPKYTPKNVCIKLGR